MQATLAPAPQAPAPVTNETRGLSTFARALGPYRSAYRMDELAATMRKMAAGTPGAQIPHLIREYTGKVVTGRTILILTCHGDEWTLRIVRADKPRPLPHSAAETEWLTFLHNRREQFSVPQAAVLHWDNPDKCAVTIRWNEIEQAQEQLI